ncbi:MAG TPA: cytochrome c3 family protein [Phycisphaerae bacterium]|nr:cytochrome c3 family protein [Phycisphaerae bacterium]
MQPVFVFLIAGAIAVAALSSGGIVGSKHDFSDQTWSHGQICQPCHHPHTPSGDVPLWAPSDELSQALPLYESPDRRLSSGDVMCLSCHDGAVAGDIYGGANDVIVSQIGVSRATYTPGLGPASGNHPIGVRYPIHDPRYHPRAAVTADQRIKLPEGRVSCLSCHDPHGTAGHDAMLVCSNARSSLCLSCHDL